MDDDAAGAGAGADAPSLERTLRTAAEAGIRGALADLIAGDAWNSVRSEWGADDIGSDSRSGLARVRKKVREAVRKELAEFARRAGG